MDHPDLLERIKRLSNDLFQLRTAVAEAETDDTETRRNYIAALAAMCRDRAAEIEAAALMATQPPAAPGGEGEGEGE